MAEEKILKEIDKLAGMVARGFEETATKKELEQLATKEELREVEKNLSRRIDDLDTHLSAYVSDTQEHIEGLRRWVGEMDQRLKKIEHRG